MQTIILCSIECVLMYKCHKLTHFVFVCIYLLLSIVRAYFIIGLWAVSKHVNKYKFELSDITWISLSLLQGKTYS
jgi:hypothetical protein